MKNRKKLFLLLPVCLALVLELLPTGAALVFSPGPDERIRQTFSYFSLTPFGYANFAPLLTAIGTCVLLLLAFVLLLRGGTKLHRAFTYLALVCAVLSLGPLAFGTAYFTLTGAGISLCLFSAFLLSALVVKN